MNAVVTGDLTGDLAGVLRLPALDYTLHADGGGIAPTVHRPIHVAGEVAQLLLKLRPLLVGDALGVQPERAGRGRVAVRWGWFVVVGVMTRPVSLRWAGFRGSRGVVCSR